MRLPKTAHTSRPWRVHEFTKDFEIEDVWKVPTPGGPGDLGRLVEWFVTDNELSVMNRTLFAIRWKLGALLDWDKADSGIGARVPSLRERLPVDLRGAARGPDLRRVPFTSIYQTDTEWAAEMSNKTAQAVMHIGWVSDGTGGYHAQMAVLVKPNGRLGKAYLSGIKPIRRALVYPSLMRTIGRWWAKAGPASPHSADELHLTP